jgi:hypothetical protein
MMNPVFVLLAASVLGVDAGWEPLPEGGHEYTVQIEPSLVARLQEGNDLLSEIPAGISIRRVRITVGTGELARVNSPTPAESPPVAAAKDPAASPRGEPSAGPEIPANFVEGNSKAQPLATGQGEAGSEPQPHSAEKPRLDGGSAIPGVSQPWVPFVVAAALLALSLAANFYLGWIAHTARSRYRDAVSKMRTASA